MTSQIRITLPNDLEPALSEAAEQVGEDLHAFVINAAVERAKTECDLPVRGREHRNMRIRARALYCSKAEVARHFDLSATQVARIVSNWETAEQNFVKNVCRPEHLEQLRAAGYEAAGLIESHKGLMPEVAPLELVARLYAQHPQAAQEPQSFGVALRTIRRADTEMLLASLEELAFADLYEPLKELVLALASGGHAVDYLSLLRDLIGIFVDPEPILQRWTEEYENE